MWIDIVWVLLVVIGIWKGWSQGFIISLFTAIAWGAGILGALKLCTVASTLIQEELDFHSNCLPVISFGAIFLVIAFIIYLIGKSLEKLVEVASLGMVNKLAGVALRVTIYTLLFSIFIWLVNEAGLISPAIKVQSKTYSSLNMLSDYMINHFADYNPAIKSLFKDLQDFFEDLSHEIQS